MTIYKCSMRNTLNQVLQNIFLSLLSTRYLSQGHHSGTSAFIILQFQTYHSFSLKLEIQIHGMVTKGNEILKWFNVFIKMLFFIHNGTEVYSHFFTILHSAESTDTYLFVCTEILFTMSSLKSSSLCLLACVPWSVIHSFTF